jgi:hypothetical protein
VALPRLVVAGQGARRPLHFRDLSAAHLLLLSPRPQPRLQ